MHTADCCSPLTRLIADTLTHISLSVMPPCTTSHQLTRCGAATITTIQHRDLTLTSSNTTEEEKRTIHEEFQLLNIQEVPDHHKEISITGGYRQRLDYKECICSIFWLHNETVNIWTHLLGFFFFFSLMLKDALWVQDHIRDVTDYGANLLQLITYQVINYWFPCY